MSDLANENGRAREHGASAGLLEKAVEFDIDANENAVPPIAETPSKHDPATLSAHFAAGHDLIPVDGKAPTEKGWRRSSPLSLDRAKARMSRGGNIGVRLRDTDLVIDVDPRHFKENDDPLARLMADFGLPEAPFVRTGGGGLHLYMRKPSDVRVVNGLPDYPGIEFKSHGRQVVAAGSVHPGTGKPYRLDDDALALSLSEAPEATTALLKAIEKPSVASSSDNFGELEPERLAEWLELIDVAEYRDQKKWQDLMMSCHQATGGGIEEFVAWSTSDPDYAGDGDKIRQRWNSLDNKPGAITVKTLIAALPAERRREATESLGRVAAEDDFPDDGDGEPVTVSPADVWDGWVFVAEAMQFIRRKDGRKYHTDQWKALYGGLYPDGEILNAVWKSRIPVRKFERLIYLPGKPEFPYGSSGVFYNIWRKSGVEARLGDVTPFLDHMAFLFPNEADRELVLDYLALLVQKPAEKIHFALLVRGSQGNRLPRCQRPPRRVKAPVARRPGRLSQDHRRLARGVGLRSRPLSEQRSDACARGTWLRASQPDHAPDREVGAGRACLACGARRIDRRQGAWRRPADAQFRRAAQRARLLLAGTGRRSGRRRLAQGYAGDAGGRADRARSRPCRQRVRDRPDQHDPRGAGRAAQAGRGGHRRRPLRPRRRSRTGGMTYGNFRFLSCQREPAPQ